MADGTWRASAGRYIRQAIGKYLVEGGDPRDVKAMRRYVSEMYPWGPREHYPYKVWCEELKKHLALVERHGAHIVAETVRRTAEKVANEMFDELVAGDPQAEPEGVLTLEKLDQAIASMPRLDPKITPAEVELYRENYLANVTASSQVPVFTGDVYIDNGDGTYTRVEIVPPST